MNKEIRMFHRQDGRLEPLSGHAIPTLDYISDHENAKIRVLDFTDVRHSLCFNPIQLRYLPALNSCIAFADNIIRTAYSVNGKVQGTVFMRQAASNILAASVWAMLNSGASMCSSWPHVLALLAQKDYSDIFTVLQESGEGAPLIQPLISLYADKVLYPTEAVFAYLRTPLARMMTPEAFWVLRPGSEDFLLDGSEDTYLTISGDGDLSVTNRLFAAVATRTTVTSEPLHNVDNETIRRVEFYEPYSFKSDEAMKKVLDENYNKVMTDVDAFVRFCNQKHVKKIASRNG